MAKPKQNETVVWDDDDMWADVDEAAPGGTGAAPAAVAAEQLKVAPPIAQPGMARAVPGPEVPTIEAEKPERIEAGAKEVLPALPGAVAEVTRKTGVAGVSLVKVQRAPALAMKVEDSSARAETLRPPPLPTALKPAESSPTAARSSAPNLPKPPPLPTVPTSPPPPFWPASAATSRPAAPASMPVKVPSRKLPGGISSIFTQGKTDDHVEANEEITPDPPARPQPKPAHPKLGPAFSKSDDAQAPSEGSTQS